MLGWAGLIDEVYVHDVKSMHILQDFLRFSRGSWMSSVVSWWFDGFKFYDQSSMNFHNFKYSSSVPPYNADFLGA